MCYYSQRYIFMLPDLSRLISKQFSIFFFTFFVFFSYLFLLFSPGFFFWSQLVCQCKGWSNRICMLSVRGFQYINCHDDIIKWKYFPRYWPFVWGIHRWPVNSPHKGQWRGALMFSLICAWIHGLINNCEASDLRCHCTHYDVTVMT